MTKRGLILVALAAMTVAPAAARAETVGEVVSGSVQFWYGNTTNPRPSGHGVLPSLAPGPWKCIYDSSGSCVGQTYGGSVGEFISPFLSNGKSKADFANGGTQPGNCTAEPKPGTTTGCPVP